jgi:tetratricopeptide (TPR) repeat protein
MFIKTYGLWVFLVPLGLQLLSLPSSWAQTAKTANAGDSSLTVERAISLAEQGHCKEAMPALKRALSSQGPANARKKAGALGLRCSLSTDNRDAVLDFARLLAHQFPQDPDTLFLLVHAYSDLSSRAAQDLGRTAPQSVSAHRLNAEALEMQGKWDDAQREYETILQEHPDTQSIHYLLGRLLLSRPNVDANATARAKEEIEKELQIDPGNAGAEFILGEMARQQSQWDEAIAHFTKASKLDVNFGDAYMSLGFCLVTVKRYEEAIAPLRVAVRLQEGNPSAHYNLAVALSRSGKKEEAEKEFAVQRQLTQNNPPGEAKSE